MNALHVSVNGKLFLHPSGVVPLMKFVGSERSTARMKGEKHVLVYILIAGSTIRPPIGTVGT